MAEFAKLFDIDGIGQVLATVETADNEDEADFLIRFRIEDADGIEYRLSIDFETDAAAARCLAGLTCDTAIAIVQPLLRLRATHQAQA